MDTKDKVLELLKSAGKPMTGSDIADRTGMDRKDVGRTLQELKKEGAIGSPKACYYEVNQ